MSSCLSGAKAPVVPGGRPCLEIAGEMGMSVTLKNYVLVRDAVSRLLVIFAVKRVAERRPNG